MLDLFTVASIEYGAHTDKDTYFIFVEFLVVRVPTSSPTTTDTHDSSKQIGKYRANTTLLHIVNYLQPPELYHTLLAGPGDRPPGSATAMLQTGSTMSNVASLCIRSAQAAKTRITVFLPLTTHK